MLKKATHLSGVLTLFASLFLFGTLSAYAAECPCKIRSTGTVTCKSYNYVTKDSTIPNLTFAVDAQVCDDNECTTFTMYQLNDGTFYCGSFNKEYAEPIGGEEEAAACLDTLRGIGGECSTIGQ